MKILEFCQFGKVTLTLVGLVSQIMVRSGDPISTGTKVFSVQNSHCEHHMTTGLLKAKMSKLYLST